MHFAPGRRAAACITARIGTRAAARVGAALALSTMLMPVTGSAADYPVKPVRIIVAYAAGGGVDNVTRVIAPALSARLGQPVIVDNRPGANANLGSDLVAKSPPDGYTFLMGSTYLCFNRATMKGMSYDPAKDLMPVARTGRAPYILAVPASSDWKTVADLVAYMKANPDKASYGAVGAGSPNALLFPRNTGTNAVQVLYKGGAMAMPDLISGRLTYMIQTVSEILPHVASGKLRALAVTGTSRFSALPDVPTMKEAGVANLDGVGWWGLFASANTPQPIVDTIATEVGAVLRQPDVIEALSKMGVESAPMPAREFDAFYRSEMTSYADVAKQFNLTVE